MLHSSGKDLVTNILLRISNIINLHLLDKNLVILYSTPSNPGTEFRLTKSIAIFNSRKSNGASRKSLIDTVKLRVGSTGTYGGHTLFIALCIFFETLSGSTYLLLPTLVHLFFKIFIVFQKYVKDVLQLTPAANFLKLSLFLFLSSFLVTATCSL